MKKKSIRTAVKIYATVIGILGIWFGLFALSMLWQMLASEKVSSPGFEAFNVVLAGFLLVVAVILIVFSAVSVFGAVRAWTKGKYAFECLLAGTCFLMILFPVGTVFGGLGMWFLLSRGVKGELT